MASEHPVSGQAVAETVSLHPPLRHPSHYQLLCPLTTINSLLTNDWPVLPYTTLVLHTETGLRVSQLSKLCRMSETDPREHQIVFFIVL